MVGARKQGAGKNTSRECRTMGKSLRSWEAGEPTSPVVAHCSDSSLRTSNL